MTEAKMLFFSFPYDEGWKAKVNNADAKLCRINAGLTGLMLNRGANAVALTFTPRLRKEGTILSVMAMVALAGVPIVGWRKRFQNEGSVS